MENKPLSPEEFEIGMKKIFAVPYDEMEAHQDADALMCKLLCSLGYGNGIKIFIDGDKWYS